MARRLALLDDNQEILEQRLSVLGTTLPPLVEARVCAIAVIGSVAEGRARDDSDLDLLLVPNLRAALESAVPLWDPEGILR